MSRPRIQDPVVFDGDYRSPDIEASPIARMLPSAVFYARIFGVIWRSSSIARKGLYDQSKLMMYAQQTFRVVERQGVRINVDGLDNLTSFAGPCVIVGNHMSTMETFLLPGLVVPFKPLTFVVKQSLVSMPLFGPVMRSCDPIVVGRSNPRDDLRAMLNGGAERLAAGRSIAVFPQTTRTVQFDPGSFNSIGVKMARKADVPIVPLALRTDVWSTGKWVRDIGPIRPERPVHFAFGEPFKVDKPKEAHARVVTFIQDHLKTWYA